MPDGVHESRRKQTLERLPSGDLLAWHLVVTCPKCPPNRRERIMRVCDLVPSFGSQVALVSLIGRLRCKQGCRLTPSRIVLRNRFPAHPGPALVEVSLKDNREAEGPMRFA